MIPPAAPTRKRPGNRALFFLLGLAACRAPEVVTIRAGLLLDGAGGQSTDVVITVTGDRITRVEPWRGDAVAYDLSGKTVLPGLIDAHLHVGYLTPAGRVSLGSGESEAEQDAGEAAVVLATLQAGFTTVVSLGAPRDRDLRRDIRRGTRPGPRLLTSLEQFRDSRLTPRELRTRVRRMRSQGADVVKIFASHAVRDGGPPLFSLEQLRAICSEARRVRLRSIVHAHSDTSIALAVSAGCDQVEHGFLATRPALELMARHHIPFDPQCRLVIDNYLEHRKAFEGLRGFDSAGYATMQRFRPLLPALLREALTVPGLEVLFSTDATAGAHGRNADDLVCRVREAGEDPMHALVAATSRNARALGLGDSLGTVAPGFVADLIALDGDPLRDIEAVGRVIFVMKGGQVFVRPGGSSPLTSAQGRH